MNNAAFGVYGPFLSTSLEDELAMLRLNVSALTELSKRFARDMAARGAGKILNIASTARSSSESSGRTVSVLLLARCDVTLKDALLKEFDLELPYTRRSLERVPLEKFDWRPHEKSMTLGWLATFLAVVPTWGNMVIELTDFDIKTASAGRRPELPKTPDQLLAMFDQNYGKYREALAGTSDADLQVPWTIRNGDEVWFTQPRWLALREFIMNHIVHHRAQLGVYLRLHGISVPAIYNDSADEKGGVFRD